MSTPFIEKFIKESFKDVQDLNKRNLILTYYWYVIDSTERTRKKLSDFLGEQIKSPADDLVRVAMELKKGCKNDDQLIIKILKYVYDRTAYVSDLKNFNKIEMWADAYTTWLIKKDDCDGMNALIYVLASLAGIPQNRLWCCIGPTTAGRHYWCIYFSPKTNHWHPIDATFYPNLNEMRYRTEFNITNYGYIGVDYLFNEDDTYKPI